MRRSLRLLIISFTLVASSLPGCTSAPPPMLGCKVDSDCKNGQECRQEVCVGKSERICSAVAECLTALEGNEWNPPALDEFTGAAGNSVPPCFEAQCLAQRCKLVARSKSTACDDEDGLPCTQGACDGAGKCQVAATQSKDTCLISDGTTPKCYDKDAQHPTEQCKMCVPSIDPKAWSAMPQGASCKDGDGLPCTQGRCDGAGKCDACTDGKCKGEASIDATSCVIDGKCISSGTKRDESHPCELCSPSGNQVAWSSVKDGEACEKDGEACRPGACADGACKFKSVISGFCYLPGEKGGACVKDGALQSTNSCQICDAGNAPTQWTAKKLGAACKSPDGYVCTLDQCNSAGNCVGTPKDDLCKAGGPCTQGKCDTTAKSCTTVNLPKSATCTGSDGIACTVEHCDGSGACDDVAVADKTGCDDKLACTVDSCDPKAAKGTDGCKHTPDNKPCDDGNVCTDDVCDVKSGCTKKNNTASCTDDKLACTQQVCAAGTCSLKIDPGTCAIGGKCQKTGEKSPNGCTSCQPTKSKDAWSSVPLGVVCADDKLSCTVDQCDGKGVCSHTKLVAETCLVKGVCLSKGKTKSGGCLVCAPSVKTTDWTAVAPGKACDVDNFSCTSDTCDGKGVCAHQPQDSKCDDKLDCTRDACKPTSPFAQGSTGCENVDRCPYGHSCDKTAKACLTPKPVVLVTQSKDDPKPTNPAVFRHVLDPKTGTSRTWVVYQSQSCAEATAGKWGITKPAKLRAVLLDSVEESKPGAGKPKPKTVTFAAGLAGANVCQGFPVVAADPNSTSQGWLSWLEADVVKGTCLTGGVNGGTTRLASLNGTAPKTGVAWPAGGTMCPNPNDDNPIFVTPGFAVLPGASADPTKRKGVWARPFATSFEKAGFNQTLFTGVPGKLTTATASAINGKFSTLHPSVVDLGKADKSGNRYWVLAMDEEKSGSSYKRTLWAQGLSDAGVKKTKTSWLSSTTTGSALTDVSEVCALDAAFDAKSGTVGVVVVTRRKGMDEVVLALRDSAGKITTETVLSKKSEAVGDCRSGYAGARITAAGSDWILGMFQTTSSSNKVEGKVLVSRVVQGAMKGLKVVGTSIISDSVNGYKMNPTNALAWRGLSGLVYRPDGAVTLIVEGLDSATGKPAILVETLLVK